MIRPTGNKILIRPDPPPKHIGLIFVPEEFQRPPLTGMVIAIGGRAVTNALPGQRIYLRNEICGYQVFVGDVYHRLVFDSDVIGVVE